MNCENSNESVSSRWNLNNLALNSGSLLLNMFNLLLMITDENLLEKWSLFLVLKFFLITSKHVLSLLFLIPPLILIYQPFHLLIKSFFLPLADNPTHLVSLVLVKQYRFKVFTICRFILTTKLLLVHLKFLVKSSVIGQLWNLLLIDVLVPDMTIIVFYLLYFILFCWNSQWRYGKLLGILTHRNGPYLIIDNRAILCQFTYDVKWFLVSHFVVFQKLYLRKV